MTSVKDKKTKSTVFTIIGHTDLEALETAKKYGEPGYCLPGKYLLGPDWQK
jgi:hypothetical protein